MKIGKLIEHLQSAHARHGDLEVYAPDTDISAVKITPCRDGVSRTTDGIPEEPNELVIEFIAAP